MAREFVSPVRFAQVSVLPAAADNTGVVLEQGGKLWFSTGSAWVDVTVATTLGTAATANTGTSGATVPLLNGANTFSGNTTVSAQLGIGSISGQSSLSVTRNLSGAVSFSAIQNSGVLQPDVTGTFNYYMSALSTAAASFNVNTVYLYRANQNTIGAGSSVGNIYGFGADSTLIGATNNYGFWGNIPAGTGRWNVFMQGTANNAFAGNVRIGSTAAPTVALDVTGAGAFSGDLTASGLVAFGTSTTTGINFRLGGSITGAGTARAQQNNVTVQSDVTGSARVFESNVGTQATTFTLGELIHYQSAQAAFGAGSTVTTQTGFSAGASLIGATNNYGFRGLIPAGTGRWNLFMDGSANNHMAGALGIGTTALTGFNLRISRAITGGTIAFGVSANPIIQSDVTEAAYVYNSSPTTAAATFTLGNLTHFRAVQSPLGAGSTVISQIGFEANSTLVGATNNFGFFSDISAGVGRWGFFANNTANNAFRGNVRIGSTAAPTVALDVTGNAAISGTLSLGGVTQAVVQQGASTGQLARWNATTSRYEPLTLNTLTDAADDAAAATAGVAIGSMYRTGSTLKVRIA